jgi:ATP-dependent Clp protease protease subunit
MTLEEMLLEKSRRFLVGEINHDRPPAFTCRCFTCRAQKKDQDINLYINSPGGVVDDTLAIYDVMKFLICDVATYCIGAAPAAGRSF